MNIAGVVVLYNPSEEVLDNIKTYLPFLKKLYVVDNSTKDISFIDRIKEIEKVEYISLNGNKGIAKALKVATNKAIEEKFDYILSMDQDSKYPTEDFKYIENYVKNQDLSKIAILSINFTGGDLEPISLDKNYVEKTRLVISSGMIILLDKYKLIDGYNEDLFIDFVDFDICLQFLDKDLSIILFRNIILNHKLGKKEERKFLFLKRNKSWHSNIRYYYMFRNYYYLKKHKKYAKSFNGINKYFQLNLKKRIYYIVFSKNKLDCLKKIKQGINDGKKGILGPYQERRKK